MYLDGLYIIIQLLFGCKLVLFFIFKVLVVEEISIIQIKVGFFVFKNFVQLVLIMFMGWNEMFF